MIKNLFKDISIGTLLIEAFSVVLAVLFALGVNEWRTKLANKDLAENALKNILIEIESNKAELEIALQEHYAIRDTLEKALEENSKANKSKKTAKSVRFNYSHSVLSNTAWNSTIATQAVRFLDFETVKSMSELYELQIFYAAHGKNILREMGSIQYHQEGAGRSFLKANLFNVKISINIEESLMKSYKAFLEKQSN